MPRPCSSSPGRDATQLVLGASSGSRLAELVRGSVVGRVVREAGPIDVHIISQEEPPAGMISRADAGFLPSRRAGKPSAPWWGRSV